MTSRYMCGKLYRVGRRVVKLWGIYKCKWRNQKDCKGCPGQLKFAGSKGLHCGYMAGGKRPIYPRVKATIGGNKPHKGNTAHITGRG
jgi:hypothetical protein